jgi:transcriptional regulator with XRE-family HTH domain
VSPEQIRSLCDELGCTARELAATLGVEHKTVSGWLEGELFPTRGHVRRMEAVRQAGPDAVIRQKRGRRKVTTMQRLAEPAFWEVIRKMLEHPALFDQVAKLAAGYADPASPQKANR